MLTFLLQLGKGSYRLLTKDFGEFTLIDNLKMLLIRMILQRPCQKGFVFLELFIPIVFTNLNASHSINTLLILLHRCLIENS